MKCSVCGEEMNPVREGHTQGWICRICGNGVVTSFFDPIELDDSDYTLELNSGNEATVKNIRLIAAISDENYLTARKLILYAPSVLKTAKASEIVSIKEKLDSASILYRITPDFPYNTVDKNRSVSK